MSRKFTRRTFLAGTAAAAGTARFPAPAVALSNPRKCITESQSPGADRNDRTHCARCRGARHCFIRRAGHSLYTLRSVDRKRQARLPVQKPKTKSWWSNALDPLLRATIAMAQTAAPC